jgi:pyruvate-ferredoxin/flavodoxin oxidoreductase
VLPRDEAIARIKQSIEKTYGRKGRAVVEQNFAAVDGALARLHEVEVPAKATATRRPAADRAGRRPRFRARVTAG